MFNVKKQLKQCLQNNDPHICKEILSFLFTCSCGECCDNFYKITNSGFILVCPKCLKLYGYSSGNFIIENCTICHNFIACNFCEKCTRFSCYNCAVFYEGRLKHYTDYNNYQLHQQYAHNLKKLNQGVSLLKR